MINLSTYFSKDRQLLVVDDVETVRRIVRRLLTECGITDITVSSSAKEALPIIQSGRVSMVISDWNMPEMDGLALLHEIRAAGFTQIPFIMITASSQKDSVLKALEAGVTDYVTKPFNKQILEQKIIHTIERFCAKQEEGLEER